MVWLFEAWDDLNKLLIRNPLLEEENKKLKAGHERDLATVSRVIKEQYSLGNKVGGATPDETDDSDGDSDGEGEGVVYCYYICRHCFAFGTGDHGFVN